MIHFVFKKWHKIFTLLYKDCLHEDREYKGPVGPKLLVH